MIQENNIMHGVFDLLVPEFRNVVFSHFSDERLWVCSAVCREWQQMIFKFYSEEICGGIVFPAGSNPIFRMHCVDSQERLLEIVGLFMNTLNMNSGGEMTCTFRNQLKTRFPHENKVPYFQFICHIFSEQEKAKKCREDFNYGKEAHVAHKIKRINCPFIGKLGESAPHSKVAYGAMLTTTYWYCYKMTCNAFHLNLLNLDRLVERRIEILENNHKIISSVFDLLELRNEVFSHLNYKNLLVCLAVCKKWQQGGVYELYSRKIYPEIVFPEGCNPIAHIHCVNSQERLLEIVGLFINTLNVNSGVEITCTFKNQLKTQSPDENTPDENTPDKDNIPHFQFICHIFSEKKKAQKCHKNFREKKEANVDHKIKKINCHFIGELGANDPNFGVGYNQIMDDRMMPLFWYCYKQESNNACYLDLHDLLGKRIEILKNNRIDELKL